MFQNYVKPLIVLTCICLFLSGALAAVYGITQPVIAEAAAERTNAAMQDIIPNATGFELLDISVFDNMPATLREVYKTANDVGYIFIVASKGFSGDINIICAIDTDGRIIAVSTLSHTETKGIGTIVDEQSFLSPFGGLDSQLNGIDTVTGATISTRAFIRAIDDVFVAYDVIR